MAARASAMASAPNTQPRLSPSTGSSDTPADLADRHGTTFGDEGKDRTFSSLWRGAACGPRLALSIVEQRRNGMAIAQFDPTSVKSAAAQIGPATAKTTADGAFARLLADANASAAAKRQAE